ncbi:MAG: hypothetical protein ACR2QK_10380 [Acidimicrobiales bacterium]
MARQIADRDSQLRRLKMLGNSQELKTNSVAKKLAGFIVAGVTAMLLTFGAGALPANASQGDGFAEADAGSLGIGAGSADNQWCLADAGSLGVPDPVSACD